VVVVRTVLHGSLLRQAQKEIGKVVSRAGNRQPSDNLRRIEAGEDE
jgi:hypothetical protein